MRRGRWTRMPFALIPPLIARSEFPVVCILALPEVEAALMTIRFPDQFPSLREVDGLSDTAFRLHMTAFFWCSANQTDGLITPDDLRLVCARVRASDRFAAECVQRGAWHDARHDCGSEFCLGPVDADGWVVHDFLWHDEEQESGTGQASEEALALARRRSADATRQRRARERKAAESGEAPRKRGRPRKADKPVKPQVKNTSRDTENESRDTVIDRSDFDPRESAGVSQSKSKSDACASEKTGEPPELVAAVADAIAAKTGHVPPDGQVLVVIATVRKRARKAGKVIRDPFRYIPVAVTNEPDLYAGLLYGDPPPLAEILADEPPSAAQAGLHEYDPHPSVADVCQACDAPKSSRRHLSPTEARTA